MQSGGDTIGYASRSPRALSGNIVMIAGVDTDLTVTGVSIVKASETAGIGSKVMDNEATSAGTGALDQFVGKSARARSSSSRTSTPSPARRSPPRA